MSYVVSKVLPRCCSWDLRDPLGGIDKPPEPLDMLRPSRGIRPPISLASCSVCRSFDQRRHPPRLRKPCETVQCMKRSKKKTVVTTVVFQRMFKVTLEVKILKSFVCPRFMEQNLYQLTKDRVKLLPEGHVRNYMSQTEVGEIARIQLCFKWRIRAIQIERPRCFKWRIRAQSIDVARMTILHFFMVK